MSANNFQPRVIVLPEDDANRQIANGFIGDPSLLNWRIQVLRVAGGWIKVLERFRKNEVAGMDRYPDRLMVLLIDFDDQPRRLAKARAAIPSHLAERVFVFGALAKPEGLRQAGLGSYEEIGLPMAKDCREVTDTVWGHDLLRHNAPELERLLQQVRPILFPSN